MLSPQMVLPLANELIIDNFAGGGGTSEGLEAAFGRPVDIAINHDEQALAMHALNHPFTHHLCESVWDVDPIKVTNNQPVALVWLSPDCKHFSKAKGGTPVSKHIRGLAWVGMRWIALTKPRVLMLENVEEFKTWGPVIVGPDGKARPDPARKGKTFESFVRQLRQHGYQVDWKVLRASDLGAPTIRKRLFLIARRDGLPIVWPEQSHGEVTSSRVLAGSLNPYRTAAQCINFELPAQSIFGRKKPLATNTQRRVAKGVFRHVLNSPKPFIVTNTSGHPGASVSEPLPTITTGNHHFVGQPFVTPFITEHANASNQRTMPADTPLRTVCAQVKGGHFSVVSPQLQSVEGEGFSQQDKNFFQRLNEFDAAIQAENEVVHAIAPLRGTSPGHMNGHSIKEPLSTISAQGTHHALVGAHLTHLTHHGERAGSSPSQPLPTVTGANRGEQAVVLANLIDAGHGESCSTGAKRWSDGVRSLETPLNTVTASGAPSNLSAAYFEQANGGFFEGAGRSASTPMSTITASGANQQLVSAYLVKYYSSGGQWQAIDEPMHTLPTKARMGLVKTIQVPAGNLSQSQRENAERCAALLHEHLPEHFPAPAQLVLMAHKDSWWVLVDITLRMLVARELYRAQSFPENYIIDEIPDPKLLFRNGVQVPGDPRNIPRVKLTKTAQVRMCGNSVPPVVAQALVEVNFSHEAQYLAKSA